MTDKEFKKLIQRLEADGHRIQYTRKGHIMILHRDGQGKVLLPGTPSDHRSKRNAIAELRRNGFNV